MWAQELGSPKFRAFFFSLPLENSLFLPSLGSFLVEFWWCFKCRDAQMCAFGVLWLSCGEPRRPGLVGPPVVSHDSPRAQTCTFGGPGLQKHPKIQREDLPEREKKERNFRLEREKKERNFGRSGGGGVRGRPTNNTNRHHQQAPPTGTTNRHHQQAPSTGTTNRHHQQAPPTGTNQATTKHQPSNNQEQPRTKTMTTTTTENLATTQNTQIGQMRFGQMWSRKQIGGQIRIFWPNAVLAKCGLAKCGHDPQREISGPHPSGPHLFWVGPSPPFEPPLFEPPPSPTQNTQGKPKQLISKTLTINSEKPKSLHATETLTVAKVGLAKESVWPKSDWRRIGRSRFRPPKHHDHLH